MKTDGYNGADVAQLCRRIKIQSIRRNIDAKKAVINLSDVKYVLDDFHPSVSNDDLNRYEEYSRQLL